jgi:hypothetical protein
MCYAIYTALLGLLLLYADYTFDGIGLSVMLADGRSVTTALGWEIVAEIWPVLLLSAVAGSAVTYILTHKILRKS